MKKIKSVLLIFCLFFIACSATKKDNKLPWERGVAVKIAEIRPSDQNATSVVFKIPLREYKRALAEGGNLNTARMVELFIRDKNSTTPPEYRVFDVQRGGVFDLLHLSTADVIVSANGYIIPNQEIFFQYLTLMKDLKRGDLEVRRSGRTFNITYILTE